MSRDEEGKGAGRAPAGLVRSIRALFPDAPPPAPTPADPPADTPDRADPPGPQDPPVLLSPSEVLLTGLERFIVADAATQVALAGEIGEAARELLRTNSLDVLVDGLLKLTFAAAPPEPGTSEAGATDDSLLALAEELATPAVATALAVRLSREKRSDDRRPLSAAAAKIPGAMAPALAEALEEAPDRSSRHACIETLLALGEHGRAQAKRMIGDSRWFVARNGAALLAEFGGEDAVAELMGTLAHEHPRVRREAVLGLARLGSEDAGVLLLGKLEDPDAGVRAAAVMGLGALEVERAVRPLLELLGREEDEDLVVDILRALGRLGDPGVVPAVEKRARGTLFSKPSLPVRVAAYRALAAIGTPHAMDVLREGAEDRDPEVKRTARALLTPE